MYTQCVERSGDTLASIDDGGSGEKLANGLFTPFQADTPGVERFAQGLSERLPMIRVKCPYFRAKAAQVSRHLPHADGNWAETSNETTGLRARVSNIEPKIFGLKLRTHFGGGAFDGPSFRSLSASFFRQHQ